jgi:hypothetical protein
VAGRASSAGAVGLCVLLLAGGAVAWAVGARPAAATPPPPGGGVGPGTVELSPDSRAHPLGEVVREQLQAHYDAINERDYEAWRASVVPARAAALPEPAFRAVYASTRDGSIRVDRIDELPDGVLVRVRFVSTQDVAQAPSAVPAARICWHSSLPMTGSPPRIDLTRGGSSVPAAC